MDVEKRVKLMEEAIMMLKDLIIRHDERLDTFQAEIRESREDFNFKMNALIDSQIRNEAEISQLREVTKSALQRIENLENQK
ncbi:MAG: hypothetical protein LUM44_00325 [Pyrinomonadaceae bacterium]|nr:hypothetical protein [Pyrinomonadaceae bacterium]